MAYQRTIIRMSSRFEDVVWVNYDARFRQKAVRLKDLRWSRIDASLYQECFMGKTCPLSRCRQCGSTGHLAHQCDQQSARQGSVEVCGLFNEADGNQHRYRSCSYTHCCWNCLFMGRGQHPHPASMCPHAMAKLPVKFNFTAFPDVYGCISLVSLSQLYCTGPYRNVLWLNHYVA